jgi:hypothetical protein
VFVDSHRRRNLSCQMSSEGVVHERSPHDVRLLVSKCRKKSRADSAPTLLAVRSEFRYGLA